MCITTVEEYIDQLEWERKEVIQKIREVVNQYIDSWFVEEINYGMIGWVVPHSSYPDGYHCNPSLPLPFMNLSSQKSHVWFYHMWMYADEDISNWFVSEFPKYSSRKLDMWKSCIRFKKMNDIPYELLWELAWKISAKQWINMYEESRKK